MSDPEQDNPKSNGIIIKIGLDGKAEIFSHISGLTPAGYLNVARTLAWLSQDLIEHSIRLLGVTPKPPKGSIEGGHMGASFN